MKNAESFQCDASITSIPTQEYLTKQQVARYLNVSVRTIDSLMRARKIPFIKLTRKLVRFLKADVDTYLLQHHRIKAVGE